MGNSNVSMFVIFAIILHYCFISEVGCDNVVIESSKRETLEIITGGGGYTPPPPPQDNDGYSPSPSSICPEPPNNIHRDYQTIQAFKAAIGDDPLGITKSWVGGPSEVCKSWKGFACGTRPDTGRLSVAALNFNGFNFNGKNCRNVQIKDFIDKLTDLAIFHTNSNNFAGVVPEGVGITNINFLYELDLSNNKYTGPFPNNVLKATNLTFLDIRFNQYYGSVPSQAFNLDLDVLFLNNNNFNQQLPDNIGDTPALYLTFANNKFSGPIPRSIGRAKNLLEVLFLNNNFTGCLPYEIGNLRNTTVFDVSCNQLTGPIPHSFGCLANIEILNLANNHFYGPVLEMVCQLPNLQNLSLSGNYFTQVGPECRKLIQLKRLDVRYNCILGLPDQRTRQACTEFFSKPKLCANERSMRYIPCKNKGYPSSTETVDQQLSVAAIPAAAPPRSYDALSPNHKFRF